MFTDNTARRRLPPIWRDPSLPVTRRVYVSHGVVLAAVKYVGDALLVYAADGTIWTPDDYILTLPSLMLRPPSAWPAWWLTPAMAAWMLPFVAIGLTLSMRRAVDAARSPWWSTLFLIPWVNYALMAALSVLPSSRSGVVEPSAEASDAPGRIAAALLATAAGVMVGVAAVFLGVAAVRVNTYGLWLFVLTPFAMGACTGFVYNRGCATPRPDTSVQVVTALLLAGVAMVFFSLEGVICLLMALPLALPLALFGGALGRRVATSGDSGVSPAMFMLIALPLTATVEPSVGHTIREVRSAVVIDATPDEVWPHVVAFSDLPPPAEWFFRAGIAYPMRARIDGEGVGAVRYCEFSTGAFVEPITRWEPGRRLSFDVVESPATMRELSPYPDLSPRHLHGFLRSTRGEFRLVDLGDGRTRLEGSTWYEIEMAPEAYWRIISDALIQRIHRRVLDHIRRETEGAHARAWSTTPHVRSASADDRSPVEAHGSAAARAR